MADDRVLCLRPAGDENRQDVPGYLSAGTGGDSCRDRQGRARLRVLFLHRSQRHPARDRGSVRRPFVDRTGLPQRQGSLGAGQQQVRNLWTNVAVFNLNLWVHTLLECWAWNKPAEEICDRHDSPWDDSQRRPSHADRRKALRRETLQNQYLSLSGSHRQSSKIRASSTCS